jgi:3-oxoadipate enol-lactonase
MARPRLILCETVNLIPGSKFELMRRTGHVPPVDQPQEYARLLSEFLRATGHIGHA